MFQRTRTFKERECLNTNPLHPKAGSAYDRTCLSQHRPNPMTMLVVNPRLSVPIREFDFSYSRSPGPGGQNVNKVNTKVTLKWNVHQTQSLPEAVKDRLTTKYSRRINKVGELIVTSHRYRDQGRNIADTFTKLREMLASVATAPKKRKPRKVSKAAKKRRLEAKRRTSLRKESRKSIRLDDK